MTAGQLLREARRRHSVTQAQLAARARTTQSAVSRIERDEISPTVDTLARLLDLLGEELELTASEIDYGHDVHMIRLNLDKTPEQRLETTTRWAQEIREIHLANRA